jgi:hypothetical protein
MLTRLLGWRKGQAVTDTTTPAARSPEDKQFAEELVERARTEGVELVGPGGLLSGLTKNVLEASLEAEMSEHLGYDRHDPAGHNTGNSRNGVRAKKVLTDVGPVEIEVPRDRDGSFEPKIVRKRQRRLTGVDEMVISLVAKGLTTGEVSAHMGEVYGAEVSRDTISRITDRVIEEMSEWQNRPLDRVYPVMFIDALVVKIRDGQVTNRPVYSAIGVTVEGERDILGLWVGNGGEGARFWLQVLTEIKNRGTEDVCIVVCDGLKGLPEAIGNTWPLAVVQTSLVHHGAVHDGRACHPHRRERASSDRPSRSRHRPVPPAGDGPGAAIRSRATSAVTSDGGACLVWVIQHQGGPLWECSLESTGAARATS